VRIILSKIEKYTYISCVLQALSCDQPGAALICEHTTYCKYVFIKNNLQAIPILKNWISVYN